MADQAIARCPFCSGQADLKPMPQAPQWFRVQCGSYHCGGTTWAMLGAEAAIEAWNRRSNG